MRFIVLTLSIFTLPLAAGADENVPQDVAVAVDAMAMPGLRARLRRTAKRETAPSPTQMASRLAPSIASPAIAQVR